MGLNWGSGAAGAASGAATGASFGPWGAVAGGVIGGAAGLFGGKKKNKMKSRFDKQQQKAWESYWNNPIENSDLYKSGSNYLQNLLGGGANAFSQFEAPMIQQFNQQTAPGIAERFGAGTGSMSNSGLNNSLAQAGSNLQANLGAQRGQLQMQGLNQALQYAQQPYANQQAGFGIQSQYMETPEPSMIDQYSGKAIGNFAGQMGSNMANKWAGATG